MWVRPVDQDSMSFLLHPRVRMPHRTVEFSILLVGKKKKKIGMNNFADFVIKLKEVASWNQMKPRILT